MVFQQKGSGGVSSCCLSVLIASKISKSLTNIACLVVRDNAKASNSAK